MTQSNEEFWSRVKDGFKDCHEQISVAYSESAEYLVEGADLEHFENAERFYKYANDALDQYIANVDEYKKRCGDHDDVVVKRVMFYRDSLIGMRYKMVDIFMKAKEKHGKQG